MKHAARIVFAISLACAIIGIAPLAAVAEETWSPQATVAFDQQAYDAGDTVHATISTTNDYADALEDVTLAAEVPDGFTAQGDTSKHLDSLGTNETATLEIDLVPTASAVVGSSLPSTKDAAPWVMAGLIAIAALVIAFIGGNIRKRNAAKNVLSVFLALAIAVAWTPLPSALADEPTNNDDDAAAETNWAVASLETTDVAVPGATETTVTISSDLPFSATLPQDFAACVYLGDDFSDCNISSLTLPSATQATLTIIGAVKGDTGYGSIGFDEGDGTKYAFQDPNAYGLALVSTETAATPAEETSPVITGYIDLGSDPVHWTDNGGLKLDYLIGLTTTRGSVDLTAAGSSVALDNGSDIPTSTTVTSADSLTATLTVSPELVDAYASTMSSGERHISTAASATYGTSEITLSASVTATPKGQSAKERASWLILDDMRHALASHAAVAGNAVRDASGELLASYSIPLYAVEYEGDDSDMDAKTAKATQEGFEISEKVLVSAGYFAEAITEEGPKKLSGIFHGLASAVGIGGIKFGEDAEETITNTEIYEKLSDMSVKMDTIGAKMSALSISLSKAQTQLKYQSQVTELANLIDDCNMYKSPVMSTFKTLNDASTDGTFSDDQVNSIVKPASKDLAAKTKRMAEVKHSGTSTLDTVLKLGRLIAGNDTLGESSTLWNYFDYTASCVNWESESYGARRAFLAYVTSAYLYGYVTAYNELNIAIDAAEKPEGAAAEEELLSQLGQSAKSVANTLSKDGAIKTHTRTRTDGKELCTVNSMLYTPDAGKTGGDLSLVNLYPASREESVRKDLFYKSLDDKEADEVKVLNYSTALDRAQLEEMASRQAFVRSLGVVDGKDFSKATSIREEWKILGFNAGDAAWDYGNQPLNNMPVRCSLKGPVSSDGANYGYLMVSDVTKSQIQKDWDRSGYHHWRYWEVGCFNIDTNQYIGYKTIYHSNVYYEPVRWHNIITCEPRSAIKAGTAVTNAHAAAGSAAETA